MPTAVLVDGGFFIKRYRQIYTNKADQTAQKVAKTLHEICLKHLSSSQKEARESKGSTIGFCCYCMMRCGSKRLC